MSSNFAKSTYVLVLLLNYLRCYHVKFVNALFLLTVFIPTSKNKMNIMKYAIISVSYLCLKFICSILYIILFLDSSAFEGVDAVIHLAGENIASGSTEGPFNILGRWSDNKKNKIYDSRVDGTKLLVETLLQLKKKPKVFISSSATGFYGFRDTTTQFTEAAEKGTGFLSNVCENWENEALKYSKSGRTVCVRNGVVLSKKGGLLAKLAPLFNIGGGGNIGSGDQGLSWISVDDAVSGIEFALSNSKLSGPVNLCAPIPASNKEFTSALGRYVRAEC